MFNLFNFIEAIENFIVEVLTWILFIPKTLIKIIWNPAWIPGYVEAELTKKNKRFSEYISPVILLTLIALGLYGLYEGLGGRLFSSRNAIIQGPKTAQVGETSTLYAQPNFLFEGKLFAEIWTVTGEESKFRYELIRYTETDRVDREKFIENFTDSSVYIEKFDLDIKRDFPLTAPSKFEYTWQEPGRYFISVQFFNNYFDTSTNLKRYEFVVVEAGKSIDNIPVFENNDTGYQLQGTIFTNQERAFAIALVALLLPLWYGIIAELFKRKPITRKELLRSIYTQSMYAAPLALAALMILLSIEVFLPLVILSKSDWSKFEAGLTQVLFLLPIYIGGAVLLWFLITESRFFAKELKLPIVSSFFWVIALSLVPLEVVLLYTFSENTELLWFSLYNILIGTLFVVLIFKKVIPSAWLWLLNFPKHMKSVYANLCYIRGNIRLKKGNLDWAIKDYAKTVYLKPKSTPARLALLRVLRKLERSAEANEQERLTRPLMQKETEYNQSCFEAICGNTEKALELLKIGLEKGQTSKNWARRDPDFENIRDDPRFKELIGE